jgi:hypothetical protein
VRTKQESGFILVAVVAIVMIAALIAFAHSALQRAQRTLTHQAGGLTALNNIDAALANFVVQNRRLPCPAQGNLRINATNAGIEQLTPATGACNPVSQINGVVPWVTLGLPASAALDAWGNQITYRVDPQLADNTKLLMNMSSCSSTGIAATSAAGACSLSCTAPLNCTSLPNFLANKGLDVWDSVNPYANRGNNGGNNRALGTGAAYVLISHGQNGAGALSTQGTVMPGTGMVGTKEMPNFNGTSMVLPQTVATAFVFAPFNNTGTVAVYFDDQIHHPTITYVLTKANLKNRN